MTEARHEAGAQRVRGHSRASSKDTLATAYTALTDHGRRLPVVARRDSRSVRDCVLLSVYEARVPPVSA